PTPYESLTMNNLLVRREVFLSVRLDETMRTYGHEDTRFGWELRARKIPVLHIDNPVYHLGLEPNDVFIDKTRQAVANLRRLTREEGSKERTSLLRAYQGIRHLAPVYTRLYDAAEPLLLRSLRSERPWLRALDLLKLREMMR
ncbi:MAG: hypothetical protein WBA12_16005, partial [Catalinimonas sp.]